MESDNENTYDTRLMIKCRMDNWNTEFKESFKEMCLNYGEAGEIIITGNEIILVRPDFNGVVEVAEERPENAAEDWVAGRVQVRRYTDNERGYKIFEKDERRYNKLRNGRKKVLSKLLMSMDKEVKTKVMTSEGYQEAATAFDVLTIWNLTENVILGRGAISIFALTSRLINLKQKGDVATYIKEFKEITHDMLRLGNAAEVLEKLFDTFFVMGCDQKRFKEVLTTWYGQREWPAREEAMRTLHQYAESTSRMSAYTKNFFF